jgi:hypothetical protein
MAASVLVDVAGRRSSPATLPGYHAGRVPRNKGQSYPADPPTVEEIVAVMRRRPTTGTATGCGRCSSSSRVQACVSRRRSR